MERTRHSRIRLLAGSIALVLLAILLPAASGSPPTAAACPASMAFGVGGNTNGNSSIFPPGAVDVRVQYSGVLNDMEGGIAALNRDVTNFRRDCPGSQLILSGHSQGAAIVHVWLQRNPGVPNKVGVLYSDPKQIGTGASGGVFALGGPPVAGTDNNFGGTPTVSICRRPDHVCNGFDGYPGPEHQQYDFQPRWHAGQVGIIWT